VLDPTVCGPYINIPPADVIPEYIEYTESPASNEIVAPTDVDKR